MEIPKLTKKQKALGVYYVWMQWLNNKWVTQDTYEQGAIFSWIKHRKLKVK